MNVDDRLHGFLVTRVQPVEEIGATLIAMTHEQTGAQLIWMKNGEENKLFSITFKTTPRDSTGVFHILEHSVLGGSKKYPVKEPFLELMKSSMNTFLNAMTFPDKTMFPVSSRNDADFMNLTRVYLDAVFCPAIYDNPGIFHQEGWHVEMRKPEDTPLYKGVVFNEMKGALSSVYRRMGSEMERMLFPDNCYGFESGGDPACIPDLTYEQFLAYHREFYHPSNAWIYLDGPVDIDAVLALIDGEYLCRYTRSEEKHDIPAQAPIALKCETAEYEVAPEEPMENHAHIVTGKVLASWQEREKIAALNLIAEVLTGSNDAPLTRALLDTGLCRDVSMGVEDGVMQPFGMLEINNTEAEHLDRLMETVKTVASGLVEKGINRDDLTAALNRMEFKDRKGEEPKGLIRGINMLSSWLYGGDPMLYLGCDRLYAFLREKLNTRYYEDLLKEWLLDETGRATLTMLPSKDYGKRLVEAEQARLAALADSWTQADRDRIIEENRQLDEWQQSVDTPEQLATMPVLPLSEVSEKPLPLPTQVDSEAGVTLLRHPTSQKGLVSLSLYFNVADLNADQLSDLSALSTLLGNLPTQKKDGPTLQREIKALLGDISYGVTAFGKPQSPELCRPFFVVNAEMLEKNLTAGLSLIAEILTETSFDCPDVIRELVLQRDENMKQAIIGAGNRFAMRRARAALTAEAALTELTDGFEGYRRQHALASDPEGKLPGFIGRLKALPGAVFTVSRLTAGVTAQNAVSIAVLLSLLPTGDKPACEEVRFTLDVPRAQGILIPAAVSYSGYALPGLVRDRAVWNVASTILSLEYLWNEVRVKGGAYGAGAGVGALGDVSFYSYRDPSPAKTLTTDRGAGQFLRAFCAGKPSLDRYIISTIAQGEPLQSDDARGIAADGMWMRGITEEERAERRARTMRVKADDLAALCDALDERGTLCVVGAQQALDACADEHLTIDNL